MRRSLLLIACLLFCTTAKRMNAQVRFEPAFIEFDYYRCNLDTTFQTLLINPGDESQTSPLFSISSKFTIVEGPVGWNPGSSLTIGPHDTLHFKVRMQSRMNELATGMSFNGSGPNFAQFVVRVKWHYTGLTLRGAKWTEWKDMQVGETRYDTVMIFNPSSEPRVLEHYHIGEVGKWTSTGFDDGFVLQPGDSIQLVTSFTATEPSHNNVTVQVRDGCTTIEYSISAVVLAPLAVHCLSNSSLRVFQHGRSLNIEGCQVGASITLSDLAGRMYYGAEVKDAVHNIDLSGLPVGAYLVRISNGVDTQTRRIVVGK